jgi:hypothetical protein
MTLEICQAVYLNDTEWVLFTAIVKWVVFRLHLVCSHFKVHEGLRVWGSTIVFITLWFPPCFAFWVPECLWVVQVHTVQRMHHVLLSSSDGIPVKFLLTHWMIRTWSKWDVSSCPPQLLYFSSAVLFSYRGQLSFMIWPQIILLIPIDK